MGPQPTALWRPRDRRARRRGPGLAAARIARPARPCAAGAFVGRDDPAGRLRAAWERALGGEPGVVLVAGEPGIGKTRLLAELARAAAEDDGAAVLFGRCTEETLIPYQPFVEALDAYVAGGDAGRLAAEAGPGADELARLLPRLAPPPPQSTDGARYRLFEAVAALLRSAAARWPLLVVLDDLHWADAPTLLLLGHLARSAGPARAAAGRRLPRDRAGAHATRSRTRWPTCAASGWSSGWRCGGLERDATAALLRERMGTEGAPGPGRRGPAGDRRQPVLRRGAGQPPGGDRRAARAAGIPEGVSEVVGRAPGPPRARDRRAAAARRGGGPQLRPRGARGAARPAAARACSTRSTRRWPPGWCARRPSSRGTMSSHTR